MNLVSNLNQSSESEKKINIFLKHNHINSIIELEILFLLNKNSYQEFNSVMLEDKLHVDKVTIKNAITKLNDLSLIKAGRAIHQNECYGINANKESRSILDLLEDKYIASPRLVLEILKNSNN